MLLFSVLNFILHVQHTFYVRTYIYTHRAMILHMSLNFIVMSCHKFLCIDNINYKKIYNLLQ